MTAEIAPRITFAHSADLDAPVVTVADMFLILDNQDGTFDVWSNTAAEVDLGEARPVPEFAPDTASITLDRAIQIVQAAYRLDTEGEAAIRSAFARWSPTLKTPLRDFAAPAGEPGQSEDWGDLASISDDLIDTAVVGQDWGDALDRALRTNPDATVRDLRDTLLADHLAAEADTQILTLDSALDLPGHEHGRQALITALHGDRDCAVKVTGHWEHDTFVVERIEDVFDAQEDCWASEYGSELYPMAL